MKENVLIFGAGALSLGFLGPMLSEDYNLSFCDLEVKKDLIDSIQKENNYLINVCSDRIFPLRVCGVTALNLSSGEGKRAVQEILHSVRLVFTAVGSGGIDKVMAFMRDSSKNRKERLYIFLSENDKSIIKRWSYIQGEKLELCDTIMGRMCRIDIPDKYYKPVFPGSNEAVVAEDFHGLPVSSEIYRRAGLQGKAWEAMPGRKFKAASHLKLYGHNGAHALLSYMGALKGLKRFHEADPALVSEAVLFLNDEIIPSMTHEYGDVLNMNELKAYCARLPARITSRTFSDTIERGIRGSIDKIKEGERLVEGAMFVLKCGLVPRHFCRIIAAGIRINIRNGLLSGSDDGIISGHCKIRDGELAGLIKKEMEELS